MHAAVEARERDEDRDGDADRHDDPAQRRVGDAPRQEGERQVERRRGADVPARVAGGGRGVVELGRVGPLPPDDDRRREEDERLERERDAGQDADPPAARAPPDERADDHARDRHRGNVARSRPPVREAVQEGRATLLQPVVEPGLVAPPVEGADDHQPHGDDEGPQPERRQERPVPEVRPGPTDGGRRGVVVAVEERGVGRHRAASGSCVAGGSSSGRRRDEGCSGWWRPRNPR